MSIFSFLFRFRNKWLRSIFPIVPSVWTHTHNWTTSTFDILHTQNWNPNKSVTHGRRERGRERERERVNFICINHVRKLCAIVVNVIGVPNVLDADQQHLTTKITKPKEKRREERWIWCVPLKALRSSCCLNRVDTKVHERWNEKRSSVIDWKALWHHRWANKRVPPLKIIIIKSVSRTENAKYRGKNPNQLHNLHSPLIHYTGRARTHSNYQLIVKDHKTTITNHFFGTKSKRDLLEMDSDDVCVCVWWTHRKVHYTERSAGIFHAYLDHLVCEHLINVSMVLRGYYLLQMLQFDCDTHLIRRKPLCVCLLFGAAECIFTVSWQSKVWMIFVN